MLYMYLLLLVLYFKTKFHIVYIITTPEVYAHHVCNIQQFISRLVTVECNRTAQILTVRDALIHQIQKSQ